MTRLDLDTANTIVSAALRKDREMQTAPLSVPWLVLKPPQAWSPIRGPDRRMCCRMPCQSTATNTATLSLCFRPMTEN